ncbi:hypothetical protein ACHHYP_15633 [Achlya hypogyna]|uniref:Uncharacterized protein n=1 Tax=Achlya hypogyna TaxID=1202772 RepID=A0A1V9YAG0_ACHHY|nr:hypothetical protein ACHHYP_15633 [Achlya hypogyna]
MSVARTFRRLSSTKPLAAASASALSIHMAPIPSFAFAPPPIAPLSTAARSMLAESKPAHVECDIATVALGISAGLVVLGMSKIWVDASASDDVSKENLINYFLELTREIEYLNDQLPELTEKVIQQSKAVGGQMSEEQAHQVVVERLGQSVKATAHKLFMKYCYSVECSDKAMTDHQHDADVVAAIQRFEKVMQNSSIAQGNVTMPKLLVRDKAIDIMELLLAANDRAIEEAVNDAKMMGMKDMKVEKAMWLDAYLSKTEQYTQEIFLQVGTDEATMKNLMDQVMQDPTFAQKLEALLQEKLAKFQAQGK